MNNDKTPWHLYKMGWNPQNPRFENFVFQEIENRYFEDGISGITAGAYWGVETPRTPTPELWERQYEIDNHHWWGVPYSYVRNAINGKVGRDVINAVSHDQARWLSSFLPNRTYGGEMKWEDEYHWNDIHSNERGIYAVNRIYNTRTSPFIRSNWRIVGHYRMPEGLNKPEPFEKYKIQKDFKWEENILPEDQYYPGQTSDINRLWHGLTDKIFFNERIFNENPIKRERRVIHLDNFYFSDETKEWTGFKIFHSGQPSYWIAHPSNLELYVNMFSDAIKETREYTKLDWPPIEHSNIKICNRYQDKVWDVDQTFDFKTDTVDDFVEKNQLNLGCINFDNKGWVSKLILGSKKTLKKYRPLLTGFIVGIDNLMFGKNTLKDMFNMLIECDYVFTTTRGDRWTDDIEVFYDSLSVKWSYMPYVIIPKEEYDLYKRFGECYILTSSGALLPSYSVEFDDKKFRNMEFIDKEYVIDAKTATSH